jgi:sulfur carrier protein
MTITLNGEARQLRPASTVADLLDAMEITPRHVAVEVNLEIVPRARHGEHALREGDQVEVVTLVGGG